MSLRFEAGTDRGIKKTKELRINQPAAKTTDDADPTPSYWPRKLSIRRRWCVFFAQTVVKPVPRWGGFNARICQEILKAAEEPRLRNKSRRDRRCQLTASQKIRPRRGLSAYAALKLRSGKGREDREFSHDSTAHAVCKKQTGGNGMEDEQQLRERKTLWGNNLGGKVFEEQMKGWQSQW